MGNGGIVFPKNPHTDKVLAMHKSGMTLKVIAEELKMSYARVWQIVHHRGSPDSQDEYLKRRAKRDVEELLRKLDNGEDID